MIFASRGIIVTWNNTLDRLHPRGTPDLTPKPNNLMLLIKGLQKELAYRYLIIFIVFSILVKYIIYIVSTNSVKSSRVI